LQEPQESFASKTVNLRLSLPV